jgi:hypothetical protein
MAMDIRDRIYWWRAVLRKRYEREIEMIQTFNAAQAGGEFADRRIRQLKIELQKLEYDEAGIEPGKEEEYLYGEEVK